MIEVDSIDRGGLMHQPTQLGTSTERFSVTKFVQPFHRARVHSSRCARPFPKEFSDDDFFGETDHTSPKDFDAEGGASDLETIFDDDVSRVETTHKCVVCKSRIFSAERGRRASALGTIPIAPPPASGPLACPVA